MTPRISGRARTVASAGVLLALAALVTTAAVTGEARTEVPLDGTRNTFDLVVAGSPDPEWMPVDADFRQGDDGGYRLALGPDGELLSPGADIRLRIAARNASPRNAGRISLTIVDPNPRGEATDPDTGGYLELFEQLEFTVVDGDGTVLDAVPGSEALTVSWDEPLAAGGQTVLDVRIAMPGDVDNRWQGAGTDIRFDFEAMSS